MVRFRFPAILVIAMSGAFSGNEVPSGVPADAFYQKGSSPTALLQILKAPPRMKRPVPHPYHAPAPLSIQRNGNGVSGKAEVAITCPECLNAFPHALESLENLMREVNCIHCGNSIQYEIFEPTGPIPQQTFRRGDSAPSWAPGLSTLCN